MLRLMESTYYFRPCPKAGQFAFLLEDGESPKFYPLSYTYKECLEEWCERMGYEFHQMLRQYGTFRGHGHFEYYR